MKPLKTAGVSIIVGLAIGLLTGAYTAIKLAPFAEDLSSANQILQSMTPLLTASTIIMIAVSIFTYIGFITLGRKFKNKTLEITGWALMILLIVQSINSLLMEPLSLTDTQPSTASLIIIALIGVGMLILGIGSIKLGKKVSLSKTAGILYIITGVSLVVYYLGIAMQTDMPILALVGGLVQFAALILASILFFKASKKYEK